MKVKTGFAINDKVFYRTVTGSKVTAVIVKVNDVRPDGLGAGYSEQYKIKVTGNKNPVYMKGEQFTTSGNWLIKR